MCCESTYRPKFAAQGARNFAAHTAIFGRSLAPHLFTPSDQMSGKGWRSRVLMHNLLNPLICFDESSSVLYWFSIKKMCWYVTEVRGKLGWILIFA